MMNKEKSKYRCLMFERYKKGYCFMFYKNIDIIDLREMLII